MLFKINKSRFLFNRSIALDDEVDGRCIHSNLNAESARKVEVCNKSHGARACNPSKQPLTRSTSLNHLVLIESFIPG